jgi:hypothetical protein
VPSHSHRKKKDRQGSFYASRTALIGTVLPEILLDSPDCVEIQLQDVSYCGGRGPLGNMCG